MENWNQTFKVVISFKMTLFHLMLIMKVIQNGLRESLTILRDDGSLRPNFKPLRSRRGSASSATPSMSILNFIKH